MSKEDTNTKENINIKTKDELQINHLNDFLNEYNLNNNKDIIVGIGRLNDNDDVGIVLYANKNELLKEYPNEYKGVNVYKKKMGKIKVG